MTVLEISPQKSELRPTLVHKALDLKQHVENAFSILLASLVPNTGLKAFTHKLPILTAKVNTETCWPEKVICTVVSSPALKKKMKFHSHTTTPLPYLTFPHSSEIRSKNHVASPEDLP